MLTLITGVPRSGKSLLALDRLTKEFIPGKGEPYRPRFVHGIEDFDYQFFKAKELVDPKKWFECPVGSVILIDEAHKVFPQRTKDDKPFYVEQFAEHGHEGHDIFLVTQDPMNVDVFIRRMCGRHLHVQRILNRNIATIYEYSGYCSDPTGYHEKASAISISQWRYPKKLFDKYKSSSMHTVKARTPLKVFVLPVALIFSGVMFWKAWDSLSGGAVSESYHESLEQSGLAVTPQLEGERVGGRQIFRSASAYLDAFRPVVPGVLHTAIAYQELAEPKTFPKPLCVIIGEARNSTLSRCQCYTQQITEYETDEKICRYWARKGWFDHSKEEDGGRDQWGRRSEAQPDRPLYQVGGG